MDEIIGNFILVTGVLLYMLDVIRCNFDFKWMQF